MMGGQYAAYIIPAFGISFGVIAGLVAWSIVDYRQRLKELAELERQGVQRRSRGAENG